jgi:hypothetical protein
MEVGKTPSVNLRITEGAGDILEFCAKRGGLHVRIQKIPSGFI